MNKILHISLIAIVSTSLVGCLSGGAAKVATTELHIKRGDAEYILRNPKDTKIDELIIDPEGKLHLVGYNSAVNVNALKLAEQEMEARREERKTTFDLFDRMVQAGGGRYGVNVPPATATSPASTKTLEEATAELQRAMESIRTIRNSTNAPAK